MATDLKGWVEEDLSHLLQSQHLSRDISHKLYILKIFHKENLAIVTDFKIQMTIFFLNSSSTLCQNLHSHSFILLNDFCYGTLLQTTFKHYEFYGCGFPFLIFCSSFSMTTGRKRRTNLTWMEINESPLIKNSLALLTFPKLLEVLQKQTFHSSVIPPQYSSSYPLLTHHCEIPSDQLESLSTVNTTEPSLAQPPATSKDPVYPSLPLPVVAEEKKTYPIRNPRNRRVPTTTAAAAPTTPIKSHAQETDQSIPSSPPSMNFFEENLSEDCLVKLKLWFIGRSGIQSEHHSKAQTPLKESAAIMKQWQHESAQKKRALDEESVNPVVNGQSQRSQKKPRAGAREKIAVVREEKTAAEVSLLRLVEEVVVSVEPLVSSSSFSPVKQSSHQPSTKAQPNRKGQGKHKQVGHVAEQLRIQSKPATSAAKIDGDRDQGRVGVKPDIAPSSSSSLSQSAHEILLSNNLSRSAQLALKSYLGIPN